jgi:hypothetical protein
MRHDGHDGRFADRPLNDRPSGGRRARTLIGGLLMDLFEVVPNMRSVAVYRDGEQQNVTCCAADVDGLEPDREDGLLVTPALLRLAGWQNGASPEGPDAAIVRYGHVYQLMLPVLGGHLAIAFEVHSHPATEVQRVVDVLNRHGLDTLWLVL